MVPAKPLNNLGLPISLIVLERLRFAMGRKLLLCVI